MDPGRRAPTTVTMRTPADRFLIYNNPYSLPSVWTPDVRRGQTTYSDLLFRMKCDFGVGGIQLEPSPSGTTEQSGCSRSVLTSHSHTGLSNPRDRNPSMIKYLSTEKGTPEAHPDEREHEPRAPTMLKHYAARMVARAFKVAVLNVDDLRDWLGMVQHCGDLIKLEIWRAILEEGCIRTAVYMWKYNVSVISCVSE